MMRNVAAIIRMIEEQPFKSGHFGVLSGLMAALGRVVTGVTALSTRSGLTVLSAAEVALGQSVSRLAALSMRVHRVALFGDASALGQILTGVTTLST